MNIYQRINKVMKDVNYLKKDVKVSAGFGGTYNAVSHDAVTAALRASMIDNGIALTVNQIGQDFAERETIDGKIQKMRLYSGTYEVKFINIEEKEDFISINVCAQALDNGDKAPGKCMSYATKYALLKTFMLETGENEESRNYDHVLGDVRLTKAQAKRLLGDTADEVFRLYQSDDGPGLWQVMDECTPEEIQAIKTIFDKETQEGIHALLKVVSAEMKQAESN